MAKHFWETAVLLENMHCTHDCHALESVSFSSSMPLPLAMSLAPRHFPHTSPRPSHLATFLAPCHVPRSSPRPWHLATFLAPRHPTLAMLLLPPSVAPLPEHKLPHLVLHSPPHLVPASLYARDAAGCYSQKPRRHAVNHAEQAHGRRPPQRRRVRRKKPR